MCHVNQLGFKAETPETSGSCGLTLVIRWVGGWVVFLGDDDHADLR